MNTVLDGFYEETSQKLVTSITLAEEIQRTKVKLAAILLIQNRVHYNELGFWQDPEDYFSGLANEVIRFTGQDHFEVTDGVHYNPYSINPFIQWVNETNAAIDMTRYNDETYWEDTKLLKLPLIWRSNGTTTFGFMLWRKGVKFSV